MSDDRPETHPVLQRLQNGDPGALAALFDEYRDRLRRLIRLRMDARLSPRLDASDVLQEAYLDAVRQVKAYAHQPRVAPYVWLRGVVWERLLNLQRHHLGAQCRAAHREETLPDDPSARLARHLLAGGPTPSQAAALHELRQRVQHALGRLSAEDREMILLRHFEGLGNGEAAQVLGLSDSAAAMRHGRALLRLREVLRAALPAGESSS